MGARILIVEDEMTNRLVLETTIKKHNNSIELVSVESAAEGIYHYLTKDIALVFLDIMMPEVDGNDFLYIVEKNIVAGNLTSQGNIIVQTAIQSIEELTNLAQKECVQEVIRKPIALARIRECMDKYC